MVEPQPSRLAQDYGASRSRARPGADSRWQWAGCPDARITSAVRAWRSGPEPRPVPSCGLPAYHRAHQPGASGERKGNRGRALLQGHPEAARIADAVVGLERAVSGIAVVQEQHGWMLGQLLDAAAAEPEEESRLHELIMALIGRLDAQAEQLQRMEARLGQIGAAVERAVREAGG